MNALTTASRRSTARSGSPARSVSAPPAARAVRAGGSDRTRAAATVMSTAHTSRTLGSVRWMSESPRARDSSIAAMSAPLSSGGREGCRQDILA